MNKVNRFVIGFSFLLITGCCRAPEWVSLVNKNDYRMFVPDKYQHTSYPADTIPEEVNKSKIEIESALSGSKLGNRIIRHFYPEETETLNFKYMYTATNKNKKMILNFMAPFKVPERFAGYNLEFALEKGKIDTIYLFKVPNY